MKTRALVTFVRWTWLLALLFAGVIPAAVQADAGPGTMPANVPLTKVTLGSIVPQITETGRLALSVDGLGTTTNAGAVQVEKPAGATVRRAFMTSSTVSGSGVKLVAGDVKINGTDVTWGIETPSSISSFNYWAEVTSIVKPIVDAAPAGRVSLTITEARSPVIDGEVLAVIFDDPGQTSTNTVVLLFGAQDVNGDTFSVRFAEPINKNDPNLQLNMSLGISFSFQLNGTQQFSQIDVNGQRLTTSAGGEDDGASANGALLTVGGLDDSNANPSPLATPTQARSDDELYSLLPFVNNGDTTVTVFSRNPSNDDNIVFGAFFLKSVAAVVGEGILLAPTSSTNPVGSSHTVTATVQNTQGQPVAGRTVTFRVVSGPHMGQTGTAATNASGQAAFTYTGATVGTDTIEASFVDSQGQTKTSNQATKTWQGVTPPAQTITITFNDASGRDRQMGGEYPAGIVNWGTNSWWLASPTGKFSTKSLSLNGNKVPALTESTFAFVTPRRLLSLEAFNSGPAPAIVTLRCDGALLKQATLAAGELATITTGWAVPCGTVSLGADNGWDTNFDNLVVDNTPLPATQQLLTLNTLSGQNRALNGVNTPAPNDLVNWGSGKWFLSGPDGAFNTRSVSLANGLTQGTIGFIAPQRLVSLQAHNGGGATTTLTLSCGAQTRSATLVPGQTLTILTGWTAPCAEVGVTSTNGWDTNLDNLLLDTASAP